MRSSTQSTAVMPASLAAVERLGAVGSARRGAAGAGLSAVGSGGVGSLSLASGPRDASARRDATGRGTGRCRRAARPGSRGREALELGVDAEARADLDARRRDARVEAVERAHRRAAVALAVEVVDAAVARADEALRRPAMKRTGQPRCMQRVEIAMNWLYLSGRLRLSSSGLRLRT